MVACVLSARNREGLAMFALCVTNITSHLLVRSIKYNVLGLNQIVVSLYPCQNSKFRFPPIVCLNVTDPPGDSFPCTIVTFTLENLCELILFRFKVQMPCGSIKV